MDTPKLPDIKPEINKAEEEEDRKGSGLLASFLSKLGVGGGATGGLGVGSGGLLAGLMATKAGIVALVVAGSAVAGGIGLVGYKAFGPDASDSASDARFQSLFEARPKPAPGAEGSEAGGGAASDGSSDSLNALVKGNTPSAEEVAKAKAEAEAKAKADADAAAKSKADADAKAKADSDKSAKVGTAKDNKAAPGAKAGKLKAESIGKLSGVPRGGGGGGSSASTSSGNLLASARSGGLGSFSGGQRGGSGSSKALVGRKMGALGQLKSAGKDQRGAASSYGAGATYDGGRPGGAIGGEGVPEGGAGGGQGDTPPSSPGANQSGGSEDRFAEPPPTSVPGINVTPWQAAINTAAMVIAAAALLLMLAAKVGMGSAANPGNAALARVLAGIAALLGVWAIAIGAQISGGDYGQVMQGTMITLAGTCIIGASASCMFEAGSMATSGNPPIVMVVAGAAALGSMMMGYLSTPTSYPPDYFKDGKPCDLDYGFGRQDCEAAPAPAPESSSSSGSSSWQ